MSRYKKAGRTLIAPNDNRANSPHDPMAGGPAADGRRRGRPIFLFLAAAALTALPLVLCGCGKRPPASAARSATTSALYAHAHRIVSLAPSITEMLFALGLGDRVVGVTSFCEYPPQAKTITSVGGFYDPNIEAVAALRPDLVVLLANDKTALPKLKALDFHLLTVSCDTVDEVLDSILTIGKACGTPKKAVAVASGIRSRMAAIAKRTAGLPRPRVMICVGRTYGTGGLKDVYIAGKDGFYDRLLELAGAVPAYDKPGIRFPLVSREGIIELNPDIIVDLAPDLAKTRYTAKDLAKDWDCVPSVKAVKDGRVEVLTQNYVTIPGPRFVSLLEDLARIAHPGRFARP